MARLRRKRRDRDPTMLVAVRRRQPAHVDRHPGTAPLGRDGHSGRSGAKVRMPQAAIHALSLVRGTCPTAWTPRCTGTRRPLRMR